MLQKTVIYIFILITGVIFGQKNDIKVDYTYLALGTLSDYGGRIKDLRNNSKVECYGKGGEVLMDSLFKNLKVDYFDLERNDNCLISQKLYKKLNSFYSFKHDPLDIDSIFLGELNSKDIDNEVKRLSFILGVFIRSGVIVNNKYRVHLFASQSQYLVCEEILKKLGCKNVRVELIEASPWNDIIYFDPSKKLKLYLKKYDSLTEKNILNNVLH